MHTQTMVKLATVAGFLAVVLNSATGYPLVQNEEFTKNESKIRESNPKDGVEANQTEEKSIRLLGFLNALNILGGLVRRPLGGSTNGNKNQNGGVVATTPRLNGRPGLGIIPDVTKGVNTILTGVASGNLEKILEGSFIFAPNVVQLVAGNVLDRVFLPATSAPITATSAPVASAPVASAPVASAPVAPIASVAPVAPMTPVASVAEATTVKASITLEAQEQLLQIIKEQQQKIIALELESQKKPKSVGEY